MYAIGYDCLRTTLFVVQGRSQKELDKKIAISWSQEIASVSCYKKNGTLLKVVYPYEH